MTLAPIVLFVYNRPLHTRQTIEALQKNELAKHSELFVFSDNTKTDSDNMYVAEVRKYLRDIVGFKTVTIVERETNYGLANNIISGVSDVVNRFGRVIVLEDDILVSCHFLKHMNNALEFYKDEKSVMHISSYMFQVDKDGLKASFFTRQSFCWGWGTWKRSWSCFKKDSDEYIRLFDESMIMEFNLGGVYNFWNQMLLNHQKKIDTWAIFWYASIFLQNGYCLQFRDSMSRNIGFDGSGVNCQPTDLYELEISDDVPDIEYDREVILSSAGLRAIKQFYEGLRDAK